MTEIIQAMKSDAGPSDEVIMNAAARDDAITTSI